MSYTNTEILIGVLVVACLLLFYCKSTKKSGMTPQGLHFKERYTALPKAGTFDSFTTGYTYNPDLAEGNFNRGASIDDSVPIDGLHETITRQTPAGRNHKTPKRTEVDTKWKPDMTVVPSVYNADRYMYTGLAASDNDMAFMDMYVRTRTAPALPGPKNPSVGGVSMELMDFNCKDNMYPNRMI
jgi:hypothetical protein